MKKSRRLQFVSSINSLIPIKSAAWNDPNLINQKCFFFTQRMKLVQTNNKNLSLYKAIERKHTSPRTDFTARQWVDLWADEQQVVSVSGHIFN